MAVLGGKWWFDFPLHPSSHYRDGDAKILGIEKKALKIVHNLRAQINQEFRVGFNMHKKCYDKLLRI